VRRPRFAWADGDCNHRPERSALAVPCLPCDRRLPRWREQKPHSHPAGDSHAQHPKERR
jgi:hypothetical protein